LQNSKHVLQSKTIWGGIVAILSSVLILLLSHTNAIDKYFLVSNIFGGVLAIYGRIKAKHRLRFKNERNMGSH